MNPLFDYIWLIDDDYATNYYHEIIIRESGLVEQVDFFLSSQKGLEALKAIGNGSNKPIPQLIFLDINMPILDGWEFLKELEKYKFEASPAVAILSTSSNPNDKKMAEEHNRVVSFYTKPLEEQNLVDAHKRVIDLV